MARQRQIRICREGLYYSLVMIAALGGAVGRQLNLLMLVGSLLAGPLLFGLIYGWLALRRLKVERKLPPHLHSDQRLVVDVGVSNARRWLGIWAIEVEDQVAREGAHEPPTSAGVFFPHIAARQTAQVSYAGTLPRRGRYRFGPFRITTRFPLGLIRHTIVSNESEVLLVRPKLGRLTRDWAQIARENAVGGQRMQRRGLLEADFYGLRDWRAGDSRRWIHWRTSARRGSLVVRQFEQRRSQDLALLVDLWQPSDPSDTDLQHVETAISFVATMIAQACRETGRQLVLALAAQEPLYRSGSASPLFFEEQMDALSLVAAHNEPRFPRGLGRALAILPPSMSTLIVSTRAIDWADVQAAAIQGDIPLGGRPVQVLNVASPQFARHYQD